MGNYNPYDENGYTPLQKALARPLTAPSFNPNSAVSMTPTSGLSVAPQVSGAQASTGQGSPVAMTSPNKPGVVGAMPSDGMSASVPAVAAPVQTPADDLSKWGYTGAIPINNIEQQAIDFVNQMYGSGGALGTMNNAQDYYDQVLQGKYGPEGQAYLEQVLNPMRASSMQNYNEMSKALATKFSEVGGYYGGRAGVAQGRLASDTVNNMAQQEANLRYQNFNDNQGRMSGAASGLTGLAGAQSGISGDMLNYLLSTGGMITGRDATNRAQYQQATQNAYNDWVRARQEALLPYQLSQSLIGQQAITPVVTSQGSDWGAALQAAGMIGAAVV